MVQAILLTVGLVGVAAVLSSVSGSRWPMALAMAAVLGRGALRMDWRREIVEPYRRIRWRHLVVGAMALAAPVSVWLATASVPLLNFSVLSLIGLDTVGNAAGAGLQVGWPFAVPYSVLLLACLPSLALAEEYWFRRGTHGWRDGLRRSALFGLAHMLVGVPLGVALFGLGGVGLLLTGVYLRASALPAPDAWAFGTVAWLRATSEERRGVDAAAVQHLAYNLLAVVLALAVLALEAVGG